VKPHPSSSFARQIYPSNFTPSPCHRFIKLIEDNGKVRVPDVLDNRTLLPILTAPPREWYLPGWPNHSQLSSHSRPQNYTQNIDTLETAVGIRNVLQCHGSFATASCLECRIRVPGNVIEREIMQGEVPLCKSCNDSGKDWRKARNNKRKPSKQSDSEGEDEPLFPPWIMKVIAFLFCRLLILNCRRSLTSLSLVKS